MPRLLVVRYVFCIVIGLLMVFGFSDSLQAQTASQYIHKGDKEMKDGYPRSALFFYRKALSIDTNLLEANYKTAEAYRSLRNYKRAADFYRVTIDVDGQDVYPTAHLYLALMLKQLGKYPEALRRLQTFQSIYRTRDEYYRRGRDEIMACEWAMEHQNDTITYEVQRPDSGLNTRHAEMSPFIFDDTTLFYSTMRYEQDEVRRSKPVYVEIEKAIHDSLGWKSEEHELPIAIKDKHVGNGSFDAERKRFFFSVCEDLSNCLIYSTSWNASEGWSAPEPLPAPINEPGSSSTQPFFITHQGQEMLVFASDRERGRGGMDLWFVNFKKGKPLNRIRNLGSNINTEGNEITPSYDSTSSALYFSSDRLNGFGGYDIFRFDGLPGSNNIPENMGTEVNSPADDYYFIGQAADSLAYFASNRRGGIKKTNNETCCNDLYKAIPVIIEEPAEIEVDSLELVDSLVIAATDPVDSSIQETPAPVAVENPINIEELQTLLPISLYFHNDQPDPRTMATETRMTYPETMQFYLDLQSEYLDALNASALNADEKLNTGDALESFFDEDLGQSLEQLDKALKVLLIELEDSNRIDLAVKGYASTLASSDYNLNLTLRRISSMENYIREYRNGVFIPFIESGALAIERIPYGESKAASDLSDDASDQLGSIYSPAAMYERRIEILKVERQEP